MRTNTLSHITFATEWDHVNAAYVAEVTTDGETFSRPTEVSCTSKSVMTAVKALEKAVLAEIGISAPNATVRTMRSVKEDQAKAVADALSPAPVKKTAVARKKTK